VKASRVYLAGPDVFLPNAREFLLQKKALCAQVGLEGVSPLDSSDLEVSTRGLQSREVGQSIYDHNLRLIRSCQCVVAQVTPFRGPSVDAGTAWEMGFARASGLRVYAYSNVLEDFESRSEAFVCTVRAHLYGHVEASDAMQVEKLGMFDNCMIAGCVEDSGGVFIRHQAPGARLYTDLRAFEQCVAAVAKDET
jgi:nucleoside 2-deoxyribosyltransferase